jgi:hypothetical protein
MTDSVCERDPRERSGRRIAAAALGAWAWLLRLAPAAALFSLLFVLEGSLRWAGLLGVLPLIFAFAPGCPRCAASGGRDDDAYRGPPGH